MFRVKVNVCSNKTITHLTKMNEKMHEMHDNLIIHPWIAKTVNVLNMMNCSSMCKPAGFLLHIHRNTLTTCRHATLERRDRVLFSTHPLEDSVGQRRVLPWARHVETPGGGRAERGEGQRWKRMYS